MTLHLDSPSATIDTLATLRQRNAELERQLATSHTIQQRLQEQVDIIYQSMDLLDEMVLIKGPNSRIAYANKAFRDLYGMSFEQLSGLVDAPFNEPDYTQQYIRDDEYVFTTAQPLEIPSEYVTRHDGALRLVHTLKAPIRDAGGQVTHTVGVFQDITERLQAQTEHDVYGQVVSAMQHGVFVWRLEQLDDPTSLTAVTGNPAAARIAGLDLREHIGKKFGDIFPDSSETSLLATYAELIRTGQSRNLGELSFGSGDQTILFTIEAFPLLNNCIAVIFEDVTERRRAEEALRQSML